MAPTTNEADKEKGTFAKRIMLLVLAVFFSILIVLLPLDLFNAGSSQVLLTADGRAALAILVFVIILWVSEVVPFAVAALLGLLLVPLFGLYSFQDTVAYGFGNTVVLFFIGILIISSGLTRSGLADRLTGLIMNRVGYQPRRLVVVFMLVGALLSMWIVNMSVSAILLPVAMNILQKYQVAPLKSNFGRSLMIAVAWGPAIGGVSTPVGNGANIVALGYLRELAGVQIDFLRWMVVGVPVAALILPLACLILLKIFPPEDLPTDLQEQYSENLNRVDIRFTRSEIKALVIFVLAVIFWVGDPLIAAVTGLSLPIEVVALAAAIIFFLPGIDLLNWKMAQQDIDWGAIILIAAGLSLGAVVYESGAAHWLATLAFSPLGGLSLAARIFLAVLAVEMIKVFFSSNTVTGVIMVPLVIALSIELGLDPWLLAGPVAIATSLAFLLVTSSPTNVIPYTAGYFSIRDFLTAGIPLTLLAPLCVTIAFLLFGGLF